MPDDDEQWQRHALEAPPLRDNGEIDWGAVWLYQSKAGVGAPRPVFTGDVFRDVHVFGDPPEAMANVVVLQHPCALRADGNELRSVLVVARLVDFHEVLPADWSRNYAVMPLVVLKSNPPKHQAASFDELALVNSAEFKLSRRTACMKVEGIALLMQRWTHMNTRVVVPAYRFAQVTQLQVAEADGIEEWCQERQRAKVKPAQAATEATVWLNRVNDETGMKRRLLLENPQARKGIIRAMAKAARTLTDQELTAKAEAKAAKQAEAAAVEISEQPPSENVGR